MNVFVSNLKYFPKLKTSFLINLSIFKKWYLCPIFMGQYCGITRIQNMVLFCQFVLKILSKNQILTSIKGCNSVANLRKTKIYNTNLDLVTDNVYTNFGLILSIRSQDIEQQPNFEVIKGRYSVANL